MEPSQESLVAGIADALPVGIWVAKAPGGEFVYANQAFAEIMGMTARGDVAVGGYSEPYGIFTRDGKPYPEDRLPFVRALQESRVVVVDDLAIHRRDGTKIAVRAFAKPLYDEAKKAIASVAITFFDVTAEFHAVREGREIQERLARVVKHAPIILWASDLNGIVTLSEGSGLKSIGFEPGQLVGRSALELYKDEPRVLENHRRAMTGEAFSSKDSVGPYAFESNFAPLKDAAGKLVGYTGVTINVTEREQMQAQLIQADRMASLGTLAASVAHEVNTPLAYVEASLSHLSRELPRASPENLDSLRQLIDEARAGVERVKVIARDLNTFSRPHERLEPLDVREVIESALRMTSHETMRRARVVRRFGEVPPVIANEARLAQVFLNLLLNAAQALPEGSADRHEISVSTTVAGERVQVEIADTGAGIPPDVLPRIFQPFFTTKPVGQGTGLGLAICKSIVESLLGEITVESRPGRTVFRVTLPKADRPATRSEPRASQVVAGRPRVLIVDDDASLRRVLEGTLEETCELELADSGGRAVELMLGAERYDVVLCDLMMPDMTGMDVFERIRAQRPGLERTLCFMTGGAFTSGARDFLAKVSNPCFEKPFDFPSVIAQVLRERRS